MMQKPGKNLEAILNALLKLHGQIRAAVTAAYEQTDFTQLSRIAKEEEGDTIYVVDRIGEALLVEFFQKEMRPFFPLVLVAEGIPNGRMMLPAGTPEKEAHWRIIVDPIDGTRGLMYQKRSAWILTGVAENRGVKTSLPDIRLAVQTEIPLIKQHLSDTLWAIKGEGVQLQRFNRLTGESGSLQLQPSQAKTIAHGFAMLVRFFPGAREILAGMDEEIVMGALGPVQPGKAHCFEDQYISTGGQLYELMAGHDRFVADLRPLMEKILHQRGLKLGICCHPYDLCTELIAREMDIIITDERGDPLSAPLNVEADVAWVAYANKHIQTQIEPLLQAALHKRTLLS